MAPVINPLHTLHEQAEATFLPYGPGMQVVECYGEMEAEYAAIRKGAALMDAPHRSVAIVTGKDRLAFLHNKVTNDTNRLLAGQGCYAYLLNLKGRIVMDLNILQAEEATLVELDRRLTPEFLQIMEKYVFNEDVRLLDGSEQLGRLTVMGPRAGELLKKVMDAGVETLSEPFRHAKRMIGRATVTVFRNDLAGEEQYELIVPRDQMVTLWQILHEAGAGHEGDEGGGPAGGHGLNLNLRAIGWSAFNTARIEAGTPLYGIDISEAYLPMETGHWYPRAVAVTKGCYIGQEIVARMHAHNAVARLLVGLRPQLEAGGGDPGRAEGRSAEAALHSPGEGLPVAGTDIFDAGQQVGIVTSSVVSPMLGNVPVAMGYVKRAYAPPVGGAGGTGGGTGKAVEVLAEGKRVPTVVTTLPLWERKRT